VQDKQAEAKAVLQRAEQARADEPENQGLTAADWSDQRDKTSLQRFLCHGARLDRPHEEIHACVSTRLRVRVRPQIADLLKQGVLDYVVSDESDLMCFGVEKNGSGFMNVNKKVYRRHSIFGKELNRSLGLLERRRRHRRHRWRHDKAWMICCL
jgi:hypothetical protein